MGIQTAWAAVRRVLFWAIPAVLVAGLAWTFLPHGETPPFQSPQASTQAAVVPDKSARAQRSPLEPFAQIRQGDLEGTDSEGGRRWRIVADDVTVVQNRQVVLLRNVRAILFEKDGSTIFITGNRGQYDTKTREVEIYGSVHGMSSTGRELYGDRLHWVPGPGTITGIGHIRLLQGHTTMYADRMVSNTTLGQTQFFGHVHASVR
jgi:LPS export ABC transporter protein LptC